MNLDQEPQRAITRMLMQLFDRWSLSTEDQLAMLGLSMDNWPVLTRYRRGHSIVDSRDRLERAGHLLAIHKSLRLLFPRDRHLAYQWISTRNKAFDGRTPAEAIRKFGFSGLLMVRCYLDRQRGL